MKKNQRPKPLPLKRSETEWILEGLGLLALAVMLVYPMILYDQIPEKIPVHFNLAGEADAFGSRSTLWIIVGLGFVLFIALNSILRIPHEYNYPVKITEENAQSMYRMTQHYLIWLKVSVTILLMIIVLTTIQTAISGQNQWWAKWAFLVGFLLVLGVVVQLISRSRQIANNS